MELLPCPFCGARARSFTRLDESLWSHEQVEWLQIGCSDDCDIFMESEVHDELRERWNARALSSSPSRGEIAKVIAIAAVGRAWAANLTDEDLKGFDRDVDAILALYEGKRGSARSLPCADEGPQPRSPEPPHSDGWVLVPRAPNEAMLEAGWAVATAGRDESGAWKHDNPVLDAYAAMIAAAPAHPGGEPA